MVWWHVVLVIAVGIFLIPWLVAPLIVYRRFWFAVNPEIQTLAANALPEGVEQFFSEASRRFEKIGFTESLGDFKVSNFISDHQEQFIRAVVNSDTHESGGAVYIRQPVPHGKDIISKAYGFSSELGDHREVTTANSTHPSLPIHSEEYREIILPDIWDMALLYRIHRLSTRQAFGNQELWLPEHDDVVEALRYTFLKPARALEQLGLVRLDKEAQRYVTTIKGAYLLTWQELWPFKWLRSRRLKKLQDALIQAVEHAEVADSSSTR